MNEAPERIWAVTEPNDISADILGDVYAQQLPDGMTGTPVKYVRADRIEELEAKLRKLAVQVLSALGQEMEAYQSQLAAEAKLAKAVEVLEGIIRLDEDYSPFGGELMQDRVERTWTNARTTLAELKGGSQDGMV